ncbi:hypothetical protein P171DRAFT_492993 [Karstenula rhodostoma CBS 690.94]|uniref:Uncharacterized protein n=1 Tax=Karstenula rhodostoma CBS 690.94 TaxID=1392251 RepID=A0A9P4UJD5_9PLEO|nr:hypothetical protein P171DRAFT_492993 [Karstenula rhodostoma CBS 690.94]
MSAAMSEFSVESLEGSFSVADIQQGGVTIPTDRFAETAQDLEAVIANLKVGPIGNIEEKLQNLVDRLNQARGEVMAEDDHVVDNTSQILEDTAKISADTSTLSARMDDPVIPTLKKIVALLDSMEQERLSDKKLLEEQLSEMETQLLNDSKQIQQHIFGVVTYIAALREKVDESSVTTNKRFDLITSDVANIEQTIEDKAKFFPRIETSITTLVNTTNNNTNMLRGHGTRIDELWTAHGDATAATKEHFQNIEKRSSKFEAGVKDSVYNMAQQLRNIGDTVGNVETHVREAGTPNTENSNALRNGFSTIGDKVHENAVETKGRLLKIEETIQLSNDRADSVSSQLSTIKEVVLGQASEQIMAVSTHLERVQSNVTTKLTDIEDKIGSVISRVATVDRNQISSSSDMAAMERRLCGSQKNELDAVKERLVAIQSTMDSTKEAMCTSSGISAMEQRIYKSQDDQTELITTEMAATVNKAAVCSSADIIKKLQNLEQKLETLDNSGQTFKNLVFTRGNTHAILNQLAKISDHTRQIPGLSTIENKNCTATMEAILEKSDKFGNNIEAMSNKLALTEASMIDRISHLARLVEMFVSSSNTNIAKNAARIAAVQDTLQGLTETLSRLLSDSDDIKRDVRVVSERQTSLEKSLVTAEEAEPGTADGTVDIVSQPRPRTVTLRLSTRDKAQLNTFQNTLGKMTAEISSHLESVNEHLPVTEEMPNKLPKSTCTCCAACLDDEATTVAHHMPDTAGGSEGIAAFLSKLFFLWYSALYNLCTR